ncbi:hypothetical protein ACW9KT_10845 [Hymenobacter sp. HD11105]
MKNFVAMDLEQKRNEKYRQIADYDQTVVPIYLVIEDTNWERIKLHTCAYECQQTARTIRQEWQDNAKQRAGRLIERYGENFLSRRLREGCHAGADIDALTSRYGGEELLRRARIFQRTRPIHLVFGIKRAKELLNESQEEAKVAWLTKHEKGKSQTNNLRQYLAERLKSIASILGSDTNFVTVTQNKNVLNLYPRPLGNLLGGIDYFQHCWSEFHKAEIGAGLETVDPFFKSPDWQSTIGFNAYKRTNEYYLSILRKCADVNEGFLYEFLDEVKQHFVEGEKDLLQPLKFIARLEKALQEVDSVTKSQLSARAIETINSWLHSRKSKENKVLSWHEFPETREVLTEADRGALMKRLKGAELWINIASRDKNAEAVKKGEEGLELIKRRLSELDKALEGSLANSSHSDTITTDSINEILAPYLINYTYLDLCKLLKQLGLLDETCRSTAVASPGTWVGVIYALYEAKQPRLRGSKAAIHRAFLQTFNAQVSERAIQKGLGKIGSEAEQVRDRTLRILNE